MLRNRISSSGDSAADSHAATQADWQPRQEFHRDLENAGLGRLATTPTGLGNCDQIGALITGADYRGLGVARSLGRRGIPVWLLKRPGHRLAAASKYARNSESGRSATKPKALISCSISPSGRELKAGSLSRPTTQSLAWSRGITRFWPTILPHHPAMDKLSWFCDKRQLNKLARELKVDQPWTVYPRDREEVAQLVVPFR